MATKQIYLVRHGESENNANNVRQGPLGKLSPHGIKQAEFVADRFSKTPIDIIFVSPYERTMQTAEIINAQLKHPLEVTNLLIERRNPSEIVGKSADDPEVQKIINVIDKSFHDKNLRYSDEENFEDLKERAKALLAFLAARPEKHIMCVSHGIFIRMVALLIEFGENISSQELVRLSFLNPMHNCSTTLLEYNSWNSGDEHQGWKLIVWDDYPRLLDEMDAVQHKI